MTLYKPVSAKQARNLTRDAERRAQRLATDTAVARDRDVARRIAEAKRTELGSLIERLDAEIKVAAKDRKHSITYFRPTEDRVGLALLEEVKLHYNAQGYICTEERYEDDVNMGDFNAPCNIHVDKWILTITWPK